ncbi:hypothetical protein DSCW_55200 [Desulfosarcina widdelii]|uniref:Uncharacterized protein n=1 Tax=Desulfosarcina widdelii TaxID=947919 RepID=A0A5K7ZEF6_9BACT|nr:hypothetical protein DSCW_55200 [Desulfosarcina widdelii]
MSASASPNPGASKGAWPTSIFPFPVSWSIQWGPEETPDDIAEIFSTQRLSKRLLVPGGILGLSGLTHAAADGPGAFCSITD